MVVAWIGLFGAATLTGLFMIGDLKGMLKSRVSHLFGIDEAGTSDPQSPGDEARRIWAYSRFEKLTPDAPVWNWLDFTAINDPLRDRALAAIRAIPDRQNQVEDMISHGAGKALPSLAELALVPTPALRAGVRRFLIDVIVDIPESSAVPQPFNVAVQRMDLYWPALRWLTEHDDSSELLDALAAKVGGYPRLRDQRAFVRKLHGLRRVALAREALRH